MKKLTIFTTGGTIDKVYFDAKSSYEVGPPNIDHVLEKLNLALSYTIVTLMQKDSLDLTDKDRAKIHTAVKETDSKQILITHGTDSMVETATTLTDIPDKTIVLTGALEPALFSTSDAVFNIGCAIGAVQALAPGVYIVMNGALFTAGNVRKNVEANQFEEIRPTS